MDSFTQYRSLLFHIAYRMTGSVMDAEDIVQETFVRWEGRSAAPIENPKGFLTTITTRLCLDFLKSAKQQREDYIGPWLPTPLISTPDDPDATVALAESVSMAFLLMLETLPPIERAVFLLREVFDYRYAEVAQVTGKSEANCRQIFRRAKQHLTGIRPKYEPETSEHHQVVEQLMMAWYADDMGTLVSLLAPDVAMLSDSGGKASAARRPIYGVQSVAKVMLGLKRLVPEGSSFSFMRLNGAPALVSSTDGVPHTAMLVHIAEGQIQTFFALRNPDKLKALLKT